MPENAPSAATGTRPVLRPWPDGPSRRWPSAEADIERVRSARDRLFAGARAKTQTDKALIARDQARIAARNARAVLAAFWGGGADFELDPKAFFQVSVADALDASPAPSPDLMLLTAERDAASAAVQMEQTRAQRDQYELLHEDFPSKSALAQRRRDVFPISYLLSRSTTK